jgi:DNA (cytosine-5)-methyltransferase 1
VSLRYLSVCSGIEAATVAWHDLGWTPVAFAEIDPFASAVLQHRFPEVPNWGDITRYEAWPDTPVDLLVGGTPCQSFSVAGLRQGLADARGNLMLTYLAIAQRYQPRWILWENVPGVLSSNGGRDFGTLLGGLEELGYEWAYRTLDAQFFGVPQRRRRVYVVGCNRNHRRAAPVLFEREGSSGICPTRQGKHASAFERSDDTDSGVRCIEHDCDWDECGCWCEADMKCPWCQEWTSGLHHDTFKDGCSGCGAWVKRVCGTISDGAHMGGGLNGQDACSGRLIVDQRGRPRRLTPLETERLQGFPDHWTNIAGAKDGPRFRAIANSMAVPVMRWIGERLAAVEGLH